MKTIRLKLIRQEQGSTLLIYLFILAAMAAAAITALQAVVFDLETSEAHKKGKNAFYSAEVGLDLAVNEILNNFENLTPLHRVSRSDGLKSRWRWFYHRFQLPRL